VGQFGDPLEYFRASDLEQRCDRTRINAARHLRNDAHAQRRSCSVATLQGRADTRPNEFGQIAGSSSKLNVRSAEPLTSAYCKAASARRISSAGLIAAAATLVIAQ